MATPRRLCAGRLALVMELVEGPTLADRIAPGSIPIEEALPIATQIVDALEAAHERGITHRDLTPANIKVRPDGVVKVLDFGLAKLTGPAEAGDYVPQGGGIDRSVRHLRSMAWSRVNRAARSARTPASSRPGC
ncbi:MAG: hypothetical protein EXQ53_10085 [Acidobacteria bacterium]|nr:hypothetical protein [Acidobacteriota bacterium]